MYGQFLWGTEGLWWPQPSPRTHPLSIPAHIICFIEPTTHKSPLNTLTQLHFPIVHFTNHNLFEVYDRRTFSHCSFLWTHTTLSGAGFNTKNAKLHLLCFVPLHSSVDVNAAGLFFLFVRENVSFPTFGTSKQQHKHTGCNSKIETKEFLLGFFVFLWTQSVSFMVCVENSNRAYNANNCKATNRKMALWFSFLYSSSKPTICATIMDEGWFESTCTKTFIHKPFSTFCCMVQNPLRYTEGWYVCSFDGWKCWLPVFCECLTLTEM